MRRCFQDSFRIRHGFIHVLLETLIPISITSRKLYYFYFIFPVHVKVMIIIYPMNHRDYYKFLLFNCSCRIIIFTHFLVIPFPLSKIHFPAHFHQVMTLYSDNHDNQYFILMDIYGNKIFITLFCYIETSINFYLLLIYLLTEFNEKKKRKIILKLELRSV